MRKQQLAHEQREVGRGGYLQRMQGNGDSGTPLPQKRKDAGQLKGHVVCFHDEWWRWRDSGVTRPGVRGLPKKWNTEGYATIVVRWPGDSQPDFTCRPPAVTRTMTRTFTTAQSIV